MIVYSIRTFLNDREMPSLIVSTFHILHFFEDAPLKDQHFISRNLFFFASWSSAPPSTGVTYDFTWSSPAPALWLPHPICDKRVWCPPGSKGWAWFLCRASELARSIRT